MQDSDWLGLGHMLCPDLFYQGHSEYGQRMEMEVGKEQTLQAEILRLFLEFW